MNRALDSSLSQQHSCTPGSALTGESHSSRVQDEGTLPFIFFPSTLTFGSDVCPEAYMVSWFKKAWLDD